MSANIAIKENDKSRYFTVNSIMVDLQSNGELSEWVPESDAGLDTISISKNGTYTPEHYGFSQATVKVLQMVQGTEDDEQKLIAVDPKTGEIVETEIPTDFPIIGEDTPWISGYDPDTQNPVIIALDDNGEIHTTDVDPEFQPIIDNIIDNGIADPYVVTEDENGDEIITTYYEDTKIIATQSLPSSISIIVQPTKTQYIDGESINIAGMAVSANMSSGGTWTNSRYPNGHIPLGELSLDPNAADIDKMSTATYHGDGINASSITYAKYKDYNGSPFYAAGFGTYDGYPAVIGGGGTDGAQVLLTKYEGLIYALRLSGNNSNFDIYTNRPGFGGWVSTATTQYKTSYNKWTIAAWHKTLDAPESTVLPQGDASSLTPAGGTQTIKVSWNRPGDGKTLETSFEITVSAAGSGFSDDSGGSSSGGGVHF